MELDRIKMQVREGLGRLLPRLSQYKYALIVLLVGILLLYAGGGARDRPESNQPSGTEEAGFDLDSFEQKLTDKLSKIAGIGRVELMLSLDQTEESVYAVNTRQTSGSDSRSRESDVSVVSNGSYGETPVTVKRVLPVFRGAVVLCDGADDASVRLSVTQAVSTVCGIGADKVTVLKMKSDT